ncbi:hypothetical protein BDN70DRAFT_949969 [Pholiota conissans]|uniref:Uncharacterized protein n=1 Tax=Pholiota conissans TaxID=109636 RepID=A0A9P6CR87_9AGAR|nr:hypothetical protein BDN70DRAFT_949969 [Pholiota conissans]
MDQELPRHNIVGRPDAMPDEKVIVKPSEMEYDDWIVVQLIKIPLPKLFNNDKNACLIVDLRKSLSLYNPRHFCWALAKQKVEGKEVELWMPSFLLGYDYSTDRGKWVWLVEILSEKSTNEGFHTCTHSLKFWENIVGINEQLTLNDEDGVDLLDEVKLDRHLYNTSLYIASHRQRASNIRTLPKTEYEI